MLFRYAVSVIWKLDRDHQVKSVWYGRTVIRSKYKLSYEVAQQLCDGATASEVKGDIPELMKSDLTQEELLKWYIHTYTCMDVQYIVVSIHATYRVRLYHAIYTHIFKASRLTNYDECSMGTSLAHSEKVYVDHAA